MYNYYFNLKRLQIENFFHRFISLSLRTNIYKGSIRNRQDAFFP